MFVAHYEMLVMESCKSNRYRYREHIIPFILKPPTHRTFNQIGKIGGFSKYYVKKITLKKDMTKELFIFVLLL
jgi:hypothetical protein